MSSVKFYRGVFSGVALALLLCGCELSTSSVKMALYNNFSSNMLEIPKNTDDFKFLEGKWEDVSQSVESTHNKSIRTTYEFDKYGFGTVWVKESATNNTCIGQAQAEFIKDGLEIRTLNVVCPGGMRYLNTVAICREEKVTGTICHANNIGSNNEFSFTLRRVK